MLALKFLFDSHLELQESKHFDILPIFIIANIGNNINCNKTKLDNFLKTLFEKAGYANQY